MINPKIIDDSTFYEECAEKLNEKARAEHYGEYRTPLLIDENELKTVTDKDITGNAVLDMRNTDDVELTLTGSNMSGATTGDYPLTETVETMPSSYNVWFKPKAGTYENNAFGDSSASWDDDTKTLTVYRSGSGAVFSYSRLRLFEGTDHYNWSYRYIPTLDRKVLAYSTLADFMDSDNGQNRWIMVAGWTDRQAGTYANNMRYRVAITMNEASVNQDYTTSEENINVYSPLIEGYRYQIRPVTLGDQQSTAGMVGFATSLAIGCYGSADTTYMVRNPVLRLIPVTEELWQVLNDNIATPVSSATVNTIWGVDSEKQRSIMLFLRDEMGINIQYDETYDFPCNTSTVTLTKPEQKADFVSGKILDSGSTTGEQMFYNPKEKNSTYNWQGATNCTATYDKSTNTISMTVTETGVATSFVPSITRVSTLSESLPTGIAKLHNLGSIEIPTPSNYNDFSNKYIVIVGITDGSAPSEITERRNRIITQYNNGTGSSASLTFDWKEESNSYYTKNGYKYYCKPLICSSSCNGNRYLDCFYLNVMSPANIAVAGQTWTLTNPFVTILPLPNVTVYTTGSDNSIYYDTTNTGIIIEKLLSEGYTLKYEPFTGGEPAPNATYNSDGTLHDSTYPVGVYGTCDTLELYAPSTTLVTDGTMHAKYNSGATTVANDNVEFCVKMSK